MDKNGSTYTSRHPDKTYRNSHEHKPLVAFNEYLTYGYYPFYKEDKILYHEKLLTTLNTILDVDLPPTEKIDYYSIGKIKKLFAILAGLVPYLYPQYINAQQRDRSQPHQPAELSILSPKSPSSPAT
ncbi:hypothetical protein [uncultured Bacteroides sp.]|uniref:hypothetical protein n=1 Tax=uncultured Bacteroides sp. TaxID=162156 RepID=UPI00280BE079|nr:hypothetical protein [uncultured Bacteroides sp.]